MAVFNSAAAVSASVLDVPNSVAGASLSTSALSNSVLGVFISALSVSIVLSVGSASTDARAASCTKAFTAAPGIPELSNSIPCSFASGFCPTITCSLCTVPSTSISCCTLLGDSFNLGSTSMRSSDSCSSSPFSFSKPF